MNTRQTAQQLSELQLAVLGVLWKRGEATVVGVRLALREERQLAVTTIATVLQRLEKRGLVRHRRDGRQFVYRALVSAADVRRSMVDELTDRVFQGEVADLVSHLLSSRQVSSGDLARVRKLVEAAERRARPARRSREGSDGD